jgi:aminoglycoside phosphotransferase (APT) family kinase protein
VNASTSGSCFLHRDYRLGNTLWDGENLVGVVDWITACRGVRCGDVGHCRWNLRMSYGQSEMEIFSEYYGISSVPTSIDCSPATD